MKILPLTVLALGVALPGLASADVAGDPQKGKEAAAVCVACHQANGTGLNNAGAEAWPQLAGLNADYIVKQLADYKSGQRVNASMTAFAQMLSEQQMVDVAAYYSQLPPGAGQGGESADEATLARGKTLAERGDWSNYVISCQSCHGPGNQGAGSVFPGIAGQHAGYIEAQLKAWQADTRTNDPQDLMGSVARRMTDSDIRAVAAWLSTQPARSN